MRNANAALQYFVHFALIEQLRMTCARRLQLHGHLFTIRDIDAEVDVAEAAAADLAYETVFVADNEVAPSR